MIAGILLMLLLATLGVASYVVWPIEGVVVAGNRHHNDRAIIKRSGLELGTPWLWAWEFRLNALRQDPWIVSAQLERSEIGQIRINIKERYPVAHLEGGWGLSYDGILLPGVKQGGPLVRGSGLLPIAEVLGLVKTFPKANEIRYDATGFTVRQGSQEIWSASYQELQSYGKSRTMLPNSKVHVYGWGVSANR